MEELSTTAIVLKNEPKGEQDALVSLLTERWGKVEATATSARKITSKLAGHLQPLHIVRVRLAHKNGFRLADALTIRIAAKNPDMLDFLGFIDQMTPPLAPDGRLWQAVRKILTEASVRPDYRPLLAVLGFDPRFADCDRCDSRVIRHFNKEDFIFLCRSCGEKGKNALDPKIWLTL